MGGGGGLIGRLHSEVHEGHFTLCLFAIDQEGYKRRFPNT
jgi:hypothetical protein